MNNVSLIGRLTNDLELKNAGNTSVVNFTVAINRSVKREGQPDADFISCVAFGKTAEFMAKNLSKGSRIGISGRLQTDNFTDKEGKKRSRTEVLVANVEFADSRPTSAAEPAAEAADEDEIPFA